MAKTLAIKLSDELEQVLTAQAKQKNQSLEEFILQVLAQQATARSQSVRSLEDPLLSSIGSISIDIPDLAENHDLYIGQALLQELNPPK